MNPDANAVAAVATRRLHKRFGALQVLRGIDLDLHAGEVTILLGANGAGKTTLIRALAGDLHPDQGVIKINGKDLDAEPEQARKQLVFVSQSPPLVPTLSTLEHAMAMAAFRALQWPSYQDRLQRCADALSIGRDLNRPVRALSGGMAQKAALCLALAAQTPALLLDEPMTGLDIPSAMALRELVIEARQRGTSVLLASHLTENALAVADRAIVLSGGQVALNLNQDDLDALGGDTRAFEKVVLEAMEQNIKAEEQA